MKNIIPIILLISFFFTLLMGNHYTTQLDYIKDETNKKIDSLHQHINSLNNDINTLEGYLDSLPLGSPLDTLIISSNYGWRKSPVFKVWRMHSGTDFLASWNDTVYSTGHGTISKSGWNLGYGRQIRVLHCGGYESSYSHLYRLFVKVGDSVSLGDPIARAGNSGAVTGPHLHYEVIRDGKKSNPMEFIAARTSY
jgi:murein DD-endopeptidase MepM/ murein hydrolase activator NlpD